MSRSGAIHVVATVNLTKASGHLQHVTAYERLAANAAVTGDPAIARKALLTHPLIGQHPLSEELVDRLLEAGSEHLPQFHAETRA